MWKTARISIYQFTPPNEDKWDLIREFMERWNKEHENFIFIFDYSSWDIFLDKDGFQIYRTLVEFLEELKRKHGIIYHGFKTNHYEESDYLAADFTEFSSWQIESETPFVLNEEAISPAGGHCLKCGAWYTNTHLSDPPLIIIDEGLLKCPMEELTKPDDEEWDIVHVFTSYLISSRFKQILEANQIKGYTLRPAISHATGRESEKMYQLFADKSIIISALPEGETVQPFCDTCGTAHIPYEFDFVIKKKWIGEDGFFARDPYKGTSLHMSNRVFKLVREHQLTGLWPQAAVAVV